jgi:hypothetical protein
MAPVNAADVQARATGGDEDVVGATVAKELLAKLKVVGQHSTGRRMKRHQTRSTELGRSDR